MYIFNKIWLVNQSKTVHTNLFANNRKLHKFATTNSNLKIAYYLRHASPYNVHIYEFSA